MPRPAATQTTVRTERGVTRELEVTERNHQPSWKTYGNGYAHARIAASPSWISLNVCEAAFNDAGEVASTKEVYFTLDTAAAHALYDMLGELFATAEP